MVATKVLHKEKALVPQLRFKGFDQSWSESLLDEVAERGSGHTPNKSFGNYYNGGIKWVSLADSKKLDNGYIEDTEIEISLEGIKNSSAVLYPKESVLLSRDAGVGKSAVMKTEMAVSQHFIVWQGNNNVLSNWFLYHILQILKPEFERIAVGSTIKTIGLPYFKKLKIVLPKFPEQQKIASFLSAVDGKIQRLTRKKEMLEQYKKGLMQQLFSRKLRFKNENGTAFPEWKEKRLGEYLIKHDEKATETNQFPVLTSSRNGIMFQTEYYKKEVASADNTGYNVVPRGYFTYRHMSDDLIFKFNINHLCDKGIVSTLYPVFTTNEKVDSNFLRLKLNEGDEFKEYAILQKQGGSRTYMYYNKLENLTLKIPSLKEQLKIVDCFLKLDMRIESVGKQIAHTQTFKKGLLQQMFV